jgi:hypothetical protein
MRSRAFARSSAARAGPRERPPSFPDPPTRRPHSQSTPSSLTAARYRVVRRDQPDGAPCPFRVGQRQR